MVEHTPPIGRAHTTDERIRGGLPGTQGHPLKQWDRRRYPLSPSSHAVREYPMTYRDAFERDYNTIQEGFIRHADKILEERYRVVFGDTLNKKLLLL